MSFSLGFDTEKSVDFVSLSDVSYIRSLRKGECLIVDKDNRSHILKKSWEDVVKDEPELLIKIEHCRASLKGMSEYSVTVLVPKENIVNVSCFHGVMTHGGIKIETKHGLFVVENDPYDDEEPGYIPPHLAPFVKRAP